MRRIRTRVVLAMLLVGLLPAVPLSLAVRGLLERSFGPVLDARLEAALAAGLAESRARLAERKDLLRRAAPALAAAGRPGEVVAADSTGALIAADGAAGGGAAGSGAVAGGAAGGRAVAGITAADREALQAWAAAARPGPEPPASASDPRASSAFSAFPASPAPPASPASPGASPGALLVEPQRVNEWLAALVAGDDGAPVAVAMRLPEGLAARAATLGDGYSLLRLLQRERAAVLRSYVLPFVAIYAALVAAALLAGLWLANRLVRPLEALAASARRVAAGDLDTRCRARAGGEAGALVAAFNDMVARLAEQRRELARLERLAAWRSLARTLAHEIKNPLQPILLAVQSARQQYRGGDAEHARVLAECEEIVSEEVEGLRALVRGFSDFARPPEPRLADGDLRDLVADVARLYGAERVSVAAPEAAVPARFDAAELRRALLNLVDNALAACAEAGVAAPVRLACGRDEHGAHVSVADDGPGIAPDLLPRVFEPDFSTKKEGLGLGLAIVDSIARAHGGAASAVSELGRGATFTIRLP